MRNTNQNDKYNLLIQFGLLMQPLEEIGSADKPVSLDEIRVAISKLYGGEKDWRKSVKKFTQTAPDLIYNLENVAIGGIPFDVCRTLSNQLKRMTLQGDPGLFADPIFFQQFIAGELSGARKKLYELIDTIPIDWEAEIFEANTPFTAYLKIKQAIVPARRRLYYFDRYLKKEFFDLFLDYVDRNVKVRLVTTEGENSSRKKYGVAAVKEVSHLVAHEFIDYQLIEASYRLFHDRNLLVDNQNFSLGPGIDKAGVYLTNFNPADSSPEALAQLETIIANGVVVS